MRLKKTNRPPYIMSCFTGCDSDTICKISDIKASMRYDEIHTNDTPNVKFRFLLGLIICHKNGMPNNKIGYAVMPSLLFTMVNQYAEMAIK
jgi:hypothetical protein